MKRLSVDYSPTNRLIHNCQLKSSEFAKKLSSLLLNFETFQWCSYKIVLTRVFNAVLALSAGAFLLSWTLCVANGSVRFRWNCFGDTDLGVITIA